ncbi:MULTISPECIES: Panacea domain-containing protein [unclassified Pseudomonas]|uniref:Panacea domain-containing protein n=1 Tax=unclassified Pseudomonas TaxID=196821 RepID=UPI00384C0510
MLSSEAVANYFIQKSFEKGVDVTPMKLIKLVYIAHGWHRGYFSESLIGDAVQAWKYGPVIPELYRKIKHHRRNPIDASIPGYGIAGDANNPVPHLRTLELLDKVWNIHGKHDGLQLSALTHQPDTPWDRTWRLAGGDQYQGAIIPNEWIDQHYKEKIEASKANA